MRDDQWDRIEHMLPGKASDPGRMGDDDRLFVEAALWIARAGAPWRDLPAEFGKWNSVYRRFARWQESSVWDNVFEELAKDADFEEVFLDSTIVAYTETPQERPKKRSPSHRALARRVDGQAPRIGGCPR